MRKTIWYILRIPMKMSRSDRRHLQFLRRIPFFSSLPAAQVAAIERISRARECPKGHSIISQNETAKHLFIVLSGCVKIFSPSHGRKQKTYSYLKAGDFFGEMSLLDNKPRSALAKSVEDSKLLVIAKNDFKKLVLSNPPLGYYLLQTLSARLRLADEEIESLLFDKLIRRLAKMLLSLSRKKGGAAGLDRSYTQQEIADLLGSTREPVVRALSSLRRAGIIEARDRRYILRSPAKLASLAG